MKKISEFVGELDAWSIYASADMKKDFKDSTGFDGDWPEHTYAATSRAMEARGLGGKLTKPPGDKKLCWGYQVAIALATKHVPGFQSTKIGRGSAFWQAVEALKSSGF